METDQNIRRVYYGKECIRCGRKQGINTELNLEGRIHHNGDFVCLDNKSCKREQRKNK